MKLEYKKIKHPKYKYETTKFYSMSHILLPKTNILCNHYVNIHGKSQTLKINRSYRWDGGSFIAIDNTPMMYASIVHDALYQLIRENKLDHSFKSNADKIFEEILIQKGSFKLRAKWCYLAVKYFGWTALN